VNGVSRVVACIVAVGFLAALPGCGKPLPTMSSPEVIAVRLRGEQIVAALERYRADKGKYPMTLTALIPNYLPSIPDGSEYSDWSYSLDGYTKRYSLACLVTDRNRRTRKTLQCWAGRPFELITMHDSDL
jgi:hypothetical protein